MFPLYNQEEWVSILATIEAEDALVANAQTAHFARGSSGALPVAVGGATNGGHLSYIAYEPSRNKLHIAYSAAS